MSQSEFSRKENGTPVQGRIDPQVNMAGCAHTQIKYVMPNLRPRPPVVEHWECRDCGTWFGPLSKTPTPFGDLMSKLKQECAAFYSMMDEWALSRGVLDEARIEAVKAKQAWENAGAVEGFHVAAGLQDHSQDHTKMSPVEQALQMALTAHAGQVDKAGQPYILHAVRVALAAAVAAPPKLQQMALIVGFLHDVPEDSKTVTVQEIGKLFGEEVMVAVRRLTHYGAIGEKEYDDYIRRIQDQRESTNGQVARLVKIADLKDNLDLLRYGRRVHPPLTWEKHLTEEDLTRINKYLRALQVLEG